MCNSAVWLTIGSKSWYGTNVHWYAICQPGLMRSMQVETVARISNKKLKTTCGSFGFKKTFTVGIGDSDCVASNRSLSFSKQDPVHCPNHFRTIFVLEPTLPPPHHDFHGMNPSSGPVSHVYRSVCDKLQRGRDSLGRHVSGWASLAS